MAKVKGWGPITATSVKGFKSFADEQRIEIRPLTLLAGANSSGKSSAMQPLLLLKQTLEASYDPGPLLLYGSHVKFTSVDQLLGTFPGALAEEFEVEVWFDGNSFRNTFRKSSSHGFDLVRTTISEVGNRLILKPDQGAKNLLELEGHVPGEILRELDRQGLHWRTARSRCFLDIDFTPKRARVDAPVPLLTKNLVAPLRSILHVPGLRGNPERTYQRAAVGESFPGVFDAYVASIVAAWSDARDERLEKLRQALETLGLTSEIRAESVDAASLVVLVGRAPGRGSSTADLVNIADVGFGTSQALPVLVSLLTAQPGQLVYLEQPELHLHPRAQQALASVLVDAANRGVRVVAETHSSILLLAVQTLIAEGKIDPEKVKLHWFQRDSRGATHVHSAEMDQLGAYGDWPEDFGQVSLQADSRYLDAVEARAFPPKKRAKK